MSDDKYVRSVSLLCPTCGGDQFEIEGNEATKYNCVTCGLEIENVSLIEANSENIEEHTKEMGEEIAEDLMKSFKSAFSGARGFKFK